MRNPLARSSLLRVFQPRRIHCLCLGAAKTGTTSFAAMFEGRYRTAHEPEVAALTEAVANVLHNGGSAKSPADLDVCAWLRDRDRRLNLEVEASHPLGYMAAWLPAVFPDARFAITVREPSSWIKSRLNFHYYKTPPEWQKYRDLIWRRWHRGYHPEEEQLEALGLYSIDAYLSQYSEQYQLLFEHLPEARRIIITTEDLGAASARIAAFLNVDPATLSPRHAKAFPCEESIVDLLPADFVAWRSEEICGWLKAYL